MSDTLTPQEVFHDDIEYWLEKGVPIRTASQMVASRHKVTSRTVLRGYYRILNCVVTAELRQEDDEGLENLRRAVNLASVVSMSEARQRVQAGKRGLS